MKPQYLVVVYEDGFGKRIRIRDIPRTTKRTSGVRITPPNVRIVELGAVVVEDGDDVVLQSRRGMILRFPVSDIPAQDRRARGVKLFTLGAGDAVAGIARAPGALARLHGDAARGHASGVKGAGAGKQSHGLSARHDATQRTLFG
jgi:DNA gyrase subunit A